MCKLLTHGLVCLLFGVSTANARDGLFVEFGSLYNYVNFAEWDRGYTINEESGSIPTQSFQIGYQKPERYYFEFIYTTGDNQVDYTGYSQAGQIIRTGTDYELESSQYIFGKTFSTTVVYIGYEYNTRERFIGASSTTRPLTETLEQKQGLVGFKQTIIQSENYLVDFRFNAKMSFRSYMKVDFDQQFDDSGLHLGMDYTLFSNLYIGRRLAYNWMLGINLNYEYTEIEQSNSVSLTRNGEEQGAIFYHPYTELETYAVGISLSKNF